MVGVHDKGLSLKGFLQDSTGRPQPLCRCIGSMRLSVTRCRKATLEYAQFPGYQTQISNQVLSLYYHMITYLPICEYQSLHIS